MCAAVARQRRGSRVDADAADDEGQQADEDEPTNREIARRCSVAESSVRNYRDELSLRKLRSEPTPKTYTTKHGTVATMNTENIVKRAC